VTLSLCLRTVFWFCSIELRSCYGWVGISCLLVIAQLLYKNQLFPFSLMAVVICVVAVVICVVTRCHCCLYCLYCDLLLLFLL